MPYLVRKGVLFVVTLWAAITLNFILPRLMPGSPEDAALESSRRRACDHNAERHAVEIQLGVPTRTCSRSTGTT